MELRAHKGWLFGALAAALVATASSVPIFYHFSKGFRGEGKDYTTSRKFVGKNYTAECIEYDQKGKCERILVKVDNLFGIFSTPAGTYVLERTHPEFSRIEKDILSQ